jgi:hypothetical protein
MKEMPMSTKRVFRAEDIKKKSDDYHGVAQFERAYPNVADPEVAAKGVFHKHPTPTGLAVQQFIS